MTAARTSRLRAGMLWLAAAVAVTAAIFAAQAFGRSLSPTVGADPNPALGARVAVDQKGRTLYALSPETTRHLLCVSRPCLANWPAVTVSSARARLSLGSGVAGHLGILHRTNGTLQVTLRGRPLYRLAGDHAKGQANGNGIRSFGGTWHVVSAAGGLIAAPTTTKPTATTPTTTMPVAPPTTVPPAMTTPAPPPTPPTTTPATPMYPGGYGY
jgi:predicted lipoprotein with Yx(FWY)xxD motif